MDHRFSGPPFTVGIEEELMLVDPGTLDLAQGIETILADCGTEGIGEVKPELMQAVLEIATEPCQDLGEAAAQLRQAPGGFADFLERRAHFDFVSSPVRSVPAIMSHHFETRGNTSSRASKASV